MADTDADPATTTNFWEPLRRGQNTKFTAHKFLLVDRAFITC
jgi:hypothetical protein